MNCKKEAEKLLVKLQKITNTWYKENGLDKINDGNNCYVSVAIYENTIMMSVDPDIPESKGNELHIFRTEGGK